VSKERKMHTRFGKDYIVFIYQTLTFKYVPAIIRHFNQHPDVNSHLFYTFNIIKTRAVNQDVFHTLRFEKTDVKYKQKIE